MSREAMQMALEALELYQSRMSVQMFDEAVRALRQALETDQEPVAWMCSDFNLMHRGYSRFSPTRQGEWNIPVYTTPPRREWQGLTADEIWKCNKAKSGSAVEFHICYEHQNVEDFAESIEAKLKEKNT